MTFNKAILCGLIAVTVNGGLQAANSQQNKSASNYAVVTVGQPVEAANSKIGGQIPEPAARRDYLENVLAGCIKKRPKGQTLSDCIAYWDGLPL